MKRVFEIKVRAQPESEKEMLAFKDYIVEDCFNKTIRITVEDLPESKPEKNCGNCGGINCMNCGSVNGKPYSQWQPKVAEPQSWEQRIYEKIKTLYCHYSCVHGPDDKVKCPCFQCSNFMDIAIYEIRAEIKRVREEEKQAILKMLDEEEKESSDTGEFRGGINRAYALIESNKHKGNK